MVDGSWMGVVAPRELSLGDVADEIVSGLWVSAMPQLSWPLERWGVDVVVSVADHVAPHAGRRFEWGTAGGAAGDGKIVFVHWPIADGALPVWPLAQLVTGFVVTAVRAGLVVLVHCQEGRNRSGLVAALAVRELTGVDGRAAVAHVRARRTGMLSNRSFVAGLEQLGVNDN